MTTIRKLADYLTDLRIVAGVLATIIGVAVWLALGWTSLETRVGAVEETLEERSVLIPKIIDDLNTLKVEQAVQGEQITGIAKKSDETNGLLRELIKFIKQ